MPRHLTPDGNGTHCRDSSMRQGGVTADARKTSSDYGEWAGEGVRISGQQGDTRQRRMKRAVPIMKKYRNKKSPIPTT